MSSQYFHFTLGPVQGFVAQARRTRDLWSGSFLLSFLCAVAIKETQKQSGVLLFPKPDKNFLKALEINTDNPPQQGNIPNRFKAEVPQDFDPQKVTQAVQVAWQAIANQVLQMDLKPLQIWGEKQQRNWDSQIQNFWEISWALTSNIEDSAILDKRKNWRSHFQPTQYGDKCMMMEGYQELSCAERPNTQAQKKFWQTLQKQCKLDLRDKEKLCAMAFIKRRFAHHFDKLEAVMPSGWTLKGWPLTKNVPSLQYIAAIHWLESLLRKQENPAVKEQLDIFYQKAKKIVSLSETHTNIACIQQAMQQTSTHPITRLDGVVFYEPLLDSGSGLDAPQPNLLQALKKLNKTAQIETATPFFAILMMDGDQLGIQMSDPKKQPDISQGLETFTQKVPDIIHNHNGFLIYAGGDDVLAILPVEDAIDAAIACRQHYLNCFKNTAITTTLSGAIEFVHIKFPLMKSIVNAHQLLDDIAKEQTGRDAIAIRVMKQNNENALWSMPWQYALEEGNNFLLQQLSQLFTDSPEERGLSSRFIYKLKNQFSHFDFHAFSEEEITDLLLVDYLSSGKALLSETQARQLIVLLQTLSKQYSRSSPDAPYTIQQKLNMDAALVARFLAQKGVK